MDETYKGSQEWTHEDGDRKGRNRQTTRAVVKHVCESGGYDSQWARAKETIEETADHDCLDILGRGHRGGEKGET